MQTFFSKKGSILVFSLIVLAFLLVSSLSIATLSMVERRTSSATDRSTRSFQVADSGVELVLQKIYKGSFSTLNDLAASLGTTCNAQGEITAVLSSGTYTVSFYDNDNNKFTLADCSSATWRDRIVKVKSEGVSGNTTRAVEVAVAAPGDYDIACSEFPSPGEYPFCCRMNTGNGDTSCRYSAGAIWSDFSAKPWNAGSAGDYRIACSAGVGAGTDAFCCKLNTSSGNTECRYITAPGSSWNGMFTSPSVSNPF